MGNLYSSQKEKVIAVCIAGSDEYAQTAYIDAICELAQKYKCKILFFTSFSGTCMIEKYYEGEMEIYSLLNYELLSGIIVFAETIKDKNVLESIVKSAKCANVPVITIDHYIDGCYNIVFDCRNAIEKLVQHIVNKHGFQRIELVDDVKEDSDSKKIREIFFHIMQEKGYLVQSSLSNKNCFEFTQKKNMDLLEGKDSLKNKKVPDVVICTNDMTAITVCRKLQEAGYRVPEDVTVTGFGGLREGMDHIPSLTTVCVDTANAVDCAFRSLELLFDGGNVLHEIVLDYKVVYGESCGCAHVNNIEKRNNLVQSLYNDINIDRYFVNRLMNMTAELSECSSIKEAAEQMTEHLEMLSVSKCWICIVDNYIEDEELLQDILNKEFTGVRGYTEWIECVLYQDGKEYHHGIRFRQKEMLPRMAQELSISGQIVIAPLHVLDRTIGYFAFTYQPNQNQFHRMQSFGNSISTLLETLKYKTEQGLLIEKLEMQSLYDSLTGILNRRGFFKQLHKMYSESVREGVPVAVISVDMDNLKYINDTYGHSEGDEAIVFTAKALTKVCGSKMFCSRIGGDEFMIAGNVPEEVAVQFGRKLKALFDEHNEKDGKKYQVGFSLGLMQAKASAETAVEEFIRQADSRMYKQKEEHRKKFGYFR